MDWTPISLAELRQLIHDGESRMSPQALRLWQAIRIAPQKWSEARYGEPGGGFWVVAVIGNMAIWYNDIEDGFNCTTYADAGKIDKYMCNQDELDLAVSRILRMIEAGEDPVRRHRAPPAAGDPPRPS